MNALGTKKPANTPGLIATSFREISLGGTVPEIKIRGVSRTWRQCMTNQSKMVLFFQLLPEILLGCPSMSDQRTRQADAKDKRQEK
jgi:hypothetical protein